MYPLYNRRYFRDIQEMVENIMRSPPIPDDEPAPAPACRLTNPQPDVETGGEEDDHGDE